MRPIAPDGVAWSVCLCVYVLGTQVSCANTAEPIEMPFGVLTYVGKETSQAAQ